MRTLPLPPSRPFALALLAAGTLLQAIEVRALQVPATIRDFSSGHPDFESQFGTDRGIVEVELGADGKPIYAGNPTTPSTTDRATFDQWYRDVPGINSRHEIELDLQDDGTGLLTYQSNAFFPIDGLGFGNEGNSHNYHFTTEMHLYFTYTGGEVLSFTGDDDLFVFMNGRLVLDLGGVHPSETGQVNVDEIASGIGLVEGYTYPLDLFHAERRLIHSNFQLTTNLGIKLTPGAPPPPLNPDRDAGVDEDAGPVADAGDTPLPPATDGGPVNPEDRPGHWDFPDENGDGLPDECRIDAEAGIQCEDTTLPDLDGDGIPDVVDDDRDNDGVEDVADPDLDGDGIANADDLDLDGDGVPNAEDADVDGDGIRNEDDLDIDGDGIRNESDPDIDSDGIPNQSDPDMDGDGLANDVDDDTDGDGRPNGLDATPSGTAAAPGVDVSGVGNTGRGGEVGADDTGCACAQRGGSPGSVALWLAALLWGLGRHRRRVRSFAE